MPRSPQEFRTGDRIQFTRNNHSAKRVNGCTAEVIAIDPDEGLLVVRNKGGKRQTLDMPASPTGISVRAGSRPSMPPKARPATG